MRAPPPPRRPYWLLLVLAGLLLSPPAWGAAALIGSAIALTVLSAAVRGRAGRIASRPDAEAGILLGHDEHGAEVRMGDRQLAAHALILGASGAGKSTTLLRILTEHIREGRPVVGLDMKGSPAFAAELARAAAAAGRRLRVWTLDGPERWNPLAHGNATELKDKLIASERFTEPHYQRAAERYVQTSLQVLAELHPHRPTDLAEVVSVLEPARLLSALRGLPEPRVQRAQDYLATLTPDQLSAVRGLGTRLAILSESHSGEFLAQAAGGIDLRAALAGREVVLFSLNSSTYGKLAQQLGTLVIQDLVAAAGYRLTDPGRHPQATIGVDEFGAFSTDQIVALVARGRESGMSVLLTTQEMADLDRAAAGLRDQVAGSTAVKIAHRQDVPRSAQAIAEMAGTESRWEKTELSARGYGRARGTRRLVERFVVHPNEIKSLGTGEAVVISKLPRSSTRVVRISPPERGGPEIG